jgi:hypothetical protein
MEVVKLKHPKLKIPEMSCDKILHEKLTEYEMIKACFSTNTYTVICGKMGQGKTSLMIQILKNIYNKVFENIILIMPSLSRKSMKDDIFEKELNPDDMYDDLTAETLEHIYKKIVENSENKENTMVIIDDFAERLKIKSISLMLDKYITKFRHLHCSIFILSQNYFKLPKNSRQLINNLIFFNLGKSQLLQIFDEIMKLSKDDFKCLLNYAFQDPHDWLCLNLKNNRIFKGFGEEVIIE